MKPGTRLELDFQTRAYFSRLTRERRTKGNKSALTHEKPLYDEDQQLQDEEDENDFDSPLATSEAHNIFDDAIRILDGIIQGDQTDTISEITPTTVSKQSTSRSTRITKRKLDYLKLIRIHTYHSKHIGFFRK
jgi:hypothetical protein